MNDLSLLGNSSAPSMGEVRVKLPTWVRCHPFASQNSSFEEFLGELIRDGLLPCSRGDGQHRAGPQNQVAERTLKELQNVRH